MEKKHDVAHRVVNDLFPPFSSHAVEVKFQWRRTDNELSTARSSQLAALFGRRLWFCRVVATNQVLMAVGGLVESQDPPNCPQPSVNRSVCIIIFFMVTTLSPPPPPNFYTDLGR